MDEQKQGPSGVTDSGPESSKRKRILVAESDGFTRLVLIVLFRMAGMGVDFASNGEMALRKIRSSPPDALLAELKLCGLSGLEVIRKCRKDPQFGKRPIYVLTNEDLPRKTQKELAAESVTKVFDKRSISLENLAQSIGAELTRTLTGSSRTIRAGEIKQIIAGVRSQLKQLLKCTVPQERVEQCAELLRRICSLLSCCEAAGFGKITRQAKSLESFLAQLGKEKHELAEAATSTIARAVEILGSLSSDAGEKEDPAPLNVAIIDETPNSAKAISDALVEAGLKPIFFDDPTDTLTHLELNPVDAVIARDSHGGNVGKVRELPAHAATPIIFVSELSALDPSGKAQSGRGSAVKITPLLLRELVMKTLNEVQSKQEPHERPLPAQPAPPPAATPQHTAKPIVAASPTPSDATKSVASPVLEGDLFVRKSAQAPAVTAEENYSEVSPTPADSAPESGPAEMGIQYHHRTKTILFVEDDQFAIKFYTKALRRTGFQVEVAEDGQAALNWLPQLKPDLVVLDLMLPKLPGVEVLKFIRTHYELKDTPVIVLSNAYLDELAARAKAAGATKGLLKTGCTPAQLAEQACELLGRPEATPSVGSAMQRLQVFPANNLTEETAMWIRQAGLREEAPNEVVRIRHVCLSCIKAADANESMAHLTDLYSQVRFLSGHAALVGFTKIAEVSSALEGLLFQILFNNSAPTGSTFQTIAQAVDCLGRLVRTNDTAFAEPRITPKVMVVDTDAASNFDLVVALKRGVFEVAGVQEPVEAFRMLKGEKFDLVLLDADMPNYNGFEMCGQLRRIPSCHSIPVIFMMSNADVNSRARSIVSGGNDVIAKPVSAMELLLKATMHVLGSNDQSVAEHQAAESDPEASWSVEDILNKMQAEVYAEQSITVTANAPEIMVGAVAAGSGQAGVEAGEAMQAMQTEMSAHMIPETTNDEIWVTRTQSGDSIAESSVTTDGRQGMEGQLPEAPGEYAREREAAAKYQQERETLINRVVRSENDLHRAETQLKQKEETIEDLQKQLGQPPAPRRSAAAPEPSEPTTEDPAELRGHLQAVQDECSRQREALARYQQERETLAERIFVAENDLQETANSLKRRDEAILSLQDQLHEFEALKAEVAALRQRGSEPGARDAELEEQLNQRAAELERAKAELDKQAKVHERTESDLRQGLEVAGAAAKERETALKQIQARCAELEQESAGLRQACDELNSRLGKEQQVSAEAGKRARELEEQSNQRAAELERAKTELDKHAKGQEQTESDLRQELEAAGAAAKQAEEAQRQAIDRCAGLEQERAALRQACDELNSRFAKEEQASAEAGKRAKELEEQLNQSAVELERTKGELDKQAKGHERKESDLRRELEAALKQSQARGGQLEQELAGLRQARENLNSQIASEEHASAELRNRLKDLETQLNKRSKEHERAKAELEEQIEEHASAHSELRQKLAAAGAAVEKSKAAHQQVQARCAKFEREAGELGRANHELKQELTKEQQTSGKLAERNQELEKRAADLESAKAELDGQAKAHGHAANDLRSQLETAGAAHRETQIRAAQLEQELAGLKQVHGELTGRLAEKEQAGADSAQRVKELESSLSARTSELESAKAELERQANTHGQAANDWRSQLETTGAAHKETQLRVAQLEQELAGLKQVHGELTGRLAEKEQASADSAQRVQELENSLMASAIQLESAKAELERQAKAHGQATNDLRSQLETVGAAHKESQSRVDQLESELAAARRAGAELNSQFARAQQSGKESQARIKELEKELSSKGSPEVEELEQRVSASVAAFSRVTAELAKEKGERQRSEEQVAALNRQLQEMHQESIRALQVQGQHQERIGNLEAKLRQRDEAIARQTSELDHLKSEGEQAKEQLQKAKELNAEFLNNLSFVEEANKKANGIREDLQSRLETTLNSAHDSASKLERESAERERLATAMEKAQRELETQGRKRETLETELQTTSRTLREVETRLEQETAERQRLAAALEGTQRELQNQSRRSETLDVELQTASEALRERESNLQQQTAERQRLNGALEAAQTNLRDHSQRMQLELGKLQAALESEQVERKRQQTQIVRMRHFSLDTARGVRSLRTALRRQIREPMDNLYQSALRLLQLKLDEDHKRLAEAILQDALQVRCTLQAPEPSSNPPEPAAENT